MFLYHIYISDVTKTSRVRHILSILFLTLAHLSLLGQSIVVPSNSCSIVENFDNGNPWVLGGTNSSWVWDNPNKLDITDDISGNGKALILGGNTPTSTYNQNEDSWAESPEYDLTAANNPYIEFWFYWSNEGSTTYDEIWMEYSLNNGGSWQNLSTPIGTGSCFDQNWYNYPSNWGGNVGGCFSGLGGPTEWVLVRKCLTLLANEPSVKFRFRLSTGTSCENWGATVDDFKVCDAHIDADLSFTCTATNLLVDFNDLSEPCPDQWLWDFGDGNTSTQQNPSHQYANPGTYNVTLTASVVNSSSGGCGGPYSDTYVTSIEVIDGNLATSDIDCNGANNGSITATPSGNTGSVSYQWSPNPPTGQGTSSISSLAAGTYDVTISPLNNGCPATLSATITEPTAISGNFTITDESCSGQCDGIIVANPTGGTTPYGLSHWIGPLGNNDTISNLCGGASHDYLVTDANGCSVLLNATVGTSPSPSMSPVADQSHCENSIPLVLSFSGNPSNNYQWQVINGIDLGFGLSGSSSINLQAASNPGTTPVTSEIEVVPISGSCTGIPDTFSITILPVPELRFQADIQSGCAPLEVNFTNQSSPLAGTYNW
ncbi:MAG: PKD domain-containing protein, partial [Flavobacteriales bacterium]|nr:PKD domain-containing protein [Flavobacteriales bacterium]